MPHQEPTLPIAYVCKHCGHTWHLSLPNAENHQLICPNCGQDTSESKEDSQLPTDPDFV